MGGQRKKLTGKQEKFLEAYLTAGGRAFLNATAAARLAGYRDPEKDGWRIRKKPLVEAIIDAWHEAERERLAWRPTVTRPARPPKWMR